MLDKELYDEYNENDSTYGYKIHRCSICNCVNREDIETNIGDYKKTPFVKDPKNPLFDICVECSESIQDTNNEFEFDEYDFVYDGD